MTRLVMVNTNKEKENILNSEHCVPLAKKEKKTDKYLDLARDLKKTVEHEDDSDTNCNWSTWENPSMTGKGTVGFLN